MPLLCYDRDILHCMGRKSEETTASSASMVVIPYTLNFSRGQYFMDWLQKLENRIFAGV